MLQIFGPSATRNLLLPLVTTSIGAAVAASIAFWVLQFPKQQTVMAAVVSDNSATQDLGAYAARALGQEGAPASAETVQTSSQFMLVGVIANGNGGGSALIAIDGQAPKAYLVGQTVHETWVLTSLSARQARLQSSSTRMLLDLPSADKP